MATGISVVMLCPGPTFSNLLAVAATENPGEVKRNILFLYFPCGFGGNSSNFFVALHSFYITNADKQQKLVVQYLKC